MPITHHLNKLKLNKAVLLIALSIGCTIFISSCATVGKEFASSRILELKMGETSQQQVQAIFGQPWRTGIEDGLTTWTYAKYKYSLFGEDETEDLVIRFDKNRLVKSYSFNTTQK